MFGPWWRPVDLVQACCVLSLNFVVVLVADLIIWWRVLLLDCCFYYLDVGLSYWICWVESLEDFSVEIYFEHVTLDTLVLLVVAWRNS